MCFIKVHLQSSSIKTIISWYNSRYIWCACVVDSTTSTNYKLETTHLMCMRNVNGSIELQCKQKHKHFMEEKWSAVVDTVLYVYNMRRILCRIEKKLNGVNTFAATSSYAFIDIQSLLHTTKASRRIAVICCCVRGVVFWCWWWLCFAFILAFMLCALNILYHYPWHFYSCDACQTFGSMFATVQLFKLWSKYFFCRTNTCYSRITHIFLSH